MCVRVLNLLLPAVLLCACGGVHSWVVEEPPGVGVAELNPAEGDRAKRDVLAAPVTYRQKQQHEGRYISYQGEHYSADVV